MGTRQLKEYYTTKVKFEQHRWYVRITLELLDDEERTITFIASADSADTGGDGIWFGTEREWIDWDNN